MFKIAEMIFIVTQGHW